jgi:pimeloyl-ACP methyl ester carboxylesterase
VICKGTLRDFDVRKDLHQIRVRALVYHGAYDQSQDSVVKPFLDGLNNVRGVNFEHSSHCRHYEETEKCMDLIREFLSAE